MNLYLFKSLRIWLFYSCKKKAEKSHFDQVQWAALEKKIIIPKQHVGYNAAAHPSKLLFLNVHKGSTGDGVHCSGELAAKIHPKSCPQNSPLSGTAAPTLSLAALPIQTNPEISIQSLLLNCTSRAEYLGADRTPPDT